MFWGLTPSLNLLEEYLATNKDLPKELNFLIIGSSDCRHILLTEARKYRYQKTKINFYLIDTCVETIARKLLLLNVAFQPQLKLGLDQKTKTFMELYGNTLIRPTVAKYLTSAAIDLLKMVTNYDYLNKMMSFINLNIKYKERDYLENILKFWGGQDEFNVCDSWDRRLRKYLGVRYDSKIGAFDWDLHMRFHNVGGNQVCNQEYKNFRLNGVAFTWLESEVSRPNRSLVCGVIPNGEKFAHYGYLGDMQTGPFVAFGLDCEDKSFLQTAHGHNSYRSTDVTERNLKQIFYEIHNKEEYIHKKTTEITLGSTTVKQEKYVIDVKAENVIPKATSACINLEDKINIFSISNLSVMKYKEEYQNLFDLIYFGNSYLKYFDDDLINNISKENSLLLIENQLFVLSNRKKELEEYEISINDKIKQLNVEKICFDVQQDSYAKFVIKK